LPSWAELEQALQLQVSGERLQHTRRVVETARRLAACHGADAEKAAVAGLMHDYARGMAPAELLFVGRRYKVLTDPAEEKNPLLLHGPVAAALLAESGLVTDPDVLNAIRWHTTGRPQMSLLEKVIWLADYIEPGRSFPGAEPVRLVADQSLDGALRVALEQTIRYVLDRGWPLHLSTVRAYNWLITTGAGG
jgi:predicted HD superfamily hydrolase involved in NAD metabolism